MPLLPDVHNCSHNTDFFLGTILTGTCDNCGCTYRYCHQCGAVEEYMERDIDCRDGLCECHSNPIKELRDENKNREAIMPHAQPTDWETREIAIKTTAEWDKRHFNDDELEQLGDKVNDAFNKLEQFAIDLFAEIDPEMVIEVRD